MDKLSSLIISIASIFPYVYWNPKWLNYPWARIRFWFGYWSYFWPTRAWLVSMLMLVDTSACSRLTVSQGSVFKSLFLQSLWYDMNLPHKLWYSVRWKVHSLHCYSQVKSPKVYVHGNLNGRDVQNRGWPGCSWCFSLVLHIKVGQNGHLFTWMSVNFTVGQFQVWVTHFEIMRKQNVNL